MKSATTNSVHIDERKSENHFLVSIDCLRIGDEVSEFVPRCSRNFSVDNRAHRCAFGRIEKETGGPNELERIPFDWIVTRRDREATRRVMVLDRKLNRGSRRHSNVDDVAT